MGIYPKQIVYSVFNTPYTVRRIRQRTRLRMKRRGRRKLNLNLQTRIMSQNGLFAQVDN